MPRQSRIFRTASGGLMAQSIRISGMSILEGKQAIKASLAPMIADPNYSFAQQCLRVEVSKGGDMVISTCVMTATDAKTSQPRTEKGKYVTIYSKQTDGSWKAVADAAVPEVTM